MRKGTHKIFLQGFRPYLWIIGLGFVLYFQALGLEFVSLDDEHLIVQNQSHISSFANLPQAFLKDVYWRNPGTYYRPLLNISFMLDAAWGGIKPFAYHLTNVLLHLICGVLIFLLFDKLGFGRGKAFFVSLFCMVHPALVQAVAWVPGRNDILLAIFIVSSFLFLIRHLDSDKIWDLAGHILFFALACLTKEAAAVFPLVGLVYIWAFKKKYQPLKKLLPVFSGWVLIVVFWYWMRWQAIAPEVNAHTRQFANLAEMFKGLVSYTGKAFFPFNLSVLPLAADIRMYWGLAALLLVTFIALVKGIHNSRLFFFGLIWYLIFLLPAFIKLSGQINYLEHRLYLPILGLGVMLLETGAVRKLFPGAAMAAGLPTLLLFGTLSWFRIADFKSDQSFWENAVKTSPNSALAHQMLGRAMNRGAQLFLAEREYSLALQLDPQGPSVYNDLGLLYIKQARYDRAVILFRRVLELDPSYANVHNNLALAYYNLGNYDSSFIHLREAIRLDSLVSEPLGNLGVLFMQQGRMDSAEHYLRKALSLDPGNRTALHYLGQLRSRTILRRGL